VVSEESTSRDLVELIRRQVAAADSGDIDAMTSFFASDAVWDSSPMGLEVYEGQEAIRRFFKEWWGAYDESAFEAEEILDLGNGVTFCVFRPRGRLIHSSGEVGLRYAAVGVWVEGLIVRVTNYTDTDQARAAAERLAESRG
jgi:ketosteroid isomerase-like protein